MSSSFWYLKSKINVCLPQSSQEISVENTHGVCGFCFICKGLEIFLSNKINDKTPSDVITPIALLLADDVLLTAFDKIGQRNNLITQIIVKHDDHCSIISSLFYLFLSKVLYDCVG